MGGLIMDTNMKKIFAYVAFPVLAMLMFSSCGKEESESVGKEYSDEVEVHLIATTPSVATRTVLGDESGHRSISWGKEDTVKVIYGSSATAFKVVPVAENGEINVRVAASSYKNFFAVYPGTATAKMISTSVFSVTVPAEQDGTFGNNCMMAAYANEERLLRFHNASSTVVIDVVSDEVTKVVLRANDGTPIVGSSELTFDRESGEITGIKHGGDCSGELTVNVCGAGRYYAALLPDVDLKAGIGFNVFKGEKAAGSLSRTPLSLKTTELRVIGSVDDKLLPEGDVFIKATGTGKGTSWADAAGPDLLNKLIDVRVSADVLFDGTTTAWRLAGRKIYIAKGTYNLNSDGMSLAIGCGHSNMEIVGGFYEGSTGKDLSQYDPKSNPTVFTSQADLRIVDLVGDAGGELTLKGITFKGADTKSNGAAVAVDSPGLKVNLVDCIFTQNQTTAHGAGLYVTGGDIHLSGCTFNQNLGTTTLANSTSETSAYHNQASHGAGIYASGSATNIFLDRCEFRSNIAFSGTDIELRGGADAFIYRSIFIGSVAQAGSYFGVYPGRSINADAVAGGAVGRLCMHNCTISKTSSTYSSNGGLPLVAPTNYYCLIANCSLVDNAVASVRNNLNSDRPSPGADALWLVANLFVNSSGNAVNQNSKYTQHGFYNIMEKGKNGYATLAETDSPIAEKDFASMKFNSEKGYYSWTIDESAHPVKKPTRAFVQETVTSTCPEFDEWLSTLCESPYGIDQLGTTRNPGAITPGAWDKGL